MASFGARVRDPLVDPFDGISGQRRIPCRSAYRRDREGK
jgi:hypothetical protein